MKIGITGGKGGTGKSTVAAALAHGLAKSNSVLLIDADVDCPNDHLILSINRTKVKEVKQVIPKFDLSKCKKCGKCGEICRFNAIASVKGNFPIFVECPCNGCQACIIACPNNAIKNGERTVGELFEGRKGNLVLVSAQIIPNYAGSAFVVGKEKEYAKRLEENYDYTITDTSPGAHCNVIEALQDCDSTIAVTEPTPLGAHDLDLILRLLKILKIKTKVLINKSNIGNKSPIERVIRDYKTGIIAEIPYSRKLIEQYSKGKQIEIKAINDIIKRITK